MPDALTTADGLVTIKSNHPFKETIDRLEAALKARAMTVFARIDHAAGAAQAGLALRPTVLLIFGSAKAGTPLMQADQVVGIDLPLKFLAWCDAEGAVWLTYNDPRWIARRHGLGVVGDGPAGMMAAVLANFAKAATTGGEVK